MKIFSFPLSAPIQRNNRLVCGAVIAGLAMLLSAWILILYLGETIIGLSFGIVGGLLLCAFDGTEKSLKTCLKNWIGVPVVTTALSIILIVSATLKSQESEWRALLFFSLFWWLVWLLVSLLACYLAWLLDWLNVRFFKGE